MADFYIEEYATLGADQNGFPVAAGLHPSLATQKIAISTEADSAAFNDGTRFILIYADGACHYSVGAAPTASTSTMKLPADGTRFLAVRPGDKISVIQTS